MEVTSISVEVVQPLPHTIVRTYMSWVESQRAVVGNMIAYNISKKETVYKITMDQ
jgi:hypothetical protein